MVPVPVGGLCGARPPAGDFNPSGIPRCHRPPHFPGVSAECYCPYPDQVMLHGEEGGPGAGGDADLGVDVLDVVVDRLGEIERSAAICLVGVAAREQAQHLHLALAQPGDAVAARLGRTRWPAAASTASTASPSSRPARASRRSSAAAAVGRAGRAVGSRLGHRLVGIGGGEDARRRRRSVAGTPRW